jgi:CRISPR-associated endonuclease Cas1
MNRLLTIHRSEPVTSRVPRHGVVTLYGYGIRVSVSSGHLLLHDGIADQRRTIRLPRVNHGLRRLVIIGTDGFVTLEALRWLADQGAAFVMLDLRGKVLAVTGPVSSSDAKLRRAQALALGNSAALKIAKELINQKLAGQATLARDMLSDSETSADIERFRAELSSADAIESVRLIEAQAAKTYWQAWSELPVRWPHKDEKRVPEHWKQFGSRISPLTHSPRLAANPPNALLNFLYGILESEARLSAVAMGLDPGLGCLHVDTANRDSLACDLMEVCRPKCDAFVLDWLQREPLRRSDFWEDRNGNCRLVSSLAIKLSQTAETWRKLVAPVAEYVAQELWSSISTRTTTLARRAIATRLTQHKKREVKGSHVPEVKQPKPEHVCGNCGAKIPSDKTLCSNCAKQATRKNFRLGRKRAQQPEYLAKRVETMRTHRRAIQEWDPSTLPTWLTRDTYVKGVVPALASVAKSQIRSTLGVSEPYSSDIRAGKRVPHPRHWQALAQLVGVSERVEQPIRKTALQHPSFIRFSHLARIARGQTGSFGRTWR